jgi:methylphosphotriester-DNA--protein-cysteine methyltransferase
VIYYYPFVLTGFRGSTSNIQISDEEKLKIQAELTEKQFSKKEMKLILKLQDLLEVGQIFRDEEINVSKLAKKLSCSELTLEQIIFKRFQLSLSELITFYRVNFIIALDLKNNNKISKAEKAAMAGFKTQIEMDSAISKHHQLKN